MRCAICERLEYTNHVIKDFEELRIWEDSDFVTMFKIAYIHPPRTHTHDTLKFIAKKVLSKKRDRASYV